MTITTLKFGTVELLPASANPAQGKLRQVRELLVELQSIWIEKQFSVGDTIGSDRGWELATKILSLLPVKGSPGVSFTDWEAIASDYQLLEQIFFCQAIRVERTEQIHNWGLKFYMDDFDGCLLTRMHLFNHRELISEAQELCIKQQEIKAAQFKQPIKDDPEAQKLLAVSKSQATSESVSEVTGVANE